MSKVRTVQGVVLSFDNSTTLGRVKAEDREYSFPSTSFRAGRQPRFPRVGDKVEVVLRTNESDDATILGVSVRPQG